MDCEGVIASRDQVQRRPYSPPEVPASGGGLLGVGLPQQALDLLNRLGTLGAGDARTLYLQGEALRSLERYADAIAPLGKVAELEPENVQVLLALGWCHKRTGRIDLAIGALDAALAADGDEPLIRYNLACYHSVAGDKRAALAYLERPSHSIPTTACSLTTSRTSIRSARTRTFRPSAKAPDAGVSPFCRKGLIRAGVAVKVVTLSPSVNRFCPSRQDGPTSPYAGFVIRRIGV